MIDLDEAERIGKAATAIPWEAVEGLHDRVGVVTEFWPVSEAILSSVPMKDATFIVYARNNWQAMVDELRRLREALEYYADDERWYSEGRDCCFGPGLGSSNGKAGSRVAKLALNKVSNELSG